jgi:hypothetical protein
MTFATAAWGQDPVGTIEGQVFDPSGAVIPGATVRVTQKSTGVGHSQVTGNAGTFSFQFLAVGVYDLGVDAKGFAAYQQKAISLSINERVRMSRRWRWRARRGGWKRMLLLWIQVPTFSAKW